MDPEIWRDSMNFLGVRSALKKAARTLNYPEMVHSEDDERLLELLLWFLQKPGRRTVLGKQLLKDSRKSLHQILWSTLVDSNSYIEQNWKLEAFCVTTKQKLSFLKIDKFRKHLYEIMPQEGDLRLVLIVCCAFAMLQPKEASLIFEIMAEYDERLRTLLNEPMSEGNSEDVVCKHSEESEGLSSGAEPIPLSEAADGAGITSSNEPGGVAKLRISLTWLKAGEDLSHEFKRAHEQVCSAIRAMGPQIGSFRLDRAEPQVILNAQNPMVKAARDLDSWIDDSVGPLQEMVNNSHLQLPNEIVELETLATRSRGCVESILLCCEDLLLIIGGLKRLVEDTDREIRRLQAAIFLIHEDMGLTGTLGWIASSDDLLAAVGFENELKSIHAQILQKRDVQLGARRELLFARSTAVLDEPAENAEGIGKKIQKLQKGIEDASTLRVVDELERELESIRAEISPLVSKASLDLLAAKALESPHSTRSMLDLAAALMDKQRAGEAAVLLILMQELSELETVEEVELNDFIGMLLGCCASFAENLELASVWPQILFSSPWLASIRRSDLADQKLIPRLAAAFLCLHRFGDSSGSMGLLYALGLNADGFDGSFSNLNCLLRSVLEQSSLRYKTNNGEDELARHERVLQLFFRKTGHYYARQVAHGDEVAEMERDTLFPSLESLWHSIRAACANSKVARAPELVNSIDDLVIQAFRKHQLSTTQSPFYRKRIFDPKVGYVVEFKNAVSGYIEAWNERQKLLSDEHDHADVAGLVEELTALSESDPEFHSFWSTVAADLASAEDTTPGERMHISHPLHPLLDHDVGAISLLPTAVASYSELGGEYRPDREDLLKALEHLVGSQSASSSLAILKSSRCFRHAVLLAGSLYEGVENSAGEHEVEGLAEKAKEEQSGLFSRLANFSEPETNTVLIGREIRLGHFKYAGARIRNLELARKASADIQRRQYLEELNLLKKDCEAIESEILSANAPEDWIEEAETRIHRLRKEFNRAQRRASQGGDTSHVSHFRSLIVALEFIVQHRSRSFNELDNLLLTDVQQVDRSAAADSLTEEEALVYPELLNAWQALSNPKESTEELVRNSWGILASEFAQTNGLYHDSRKTFISTGVKDYYHCFETAFHRPRSRRLDRKISLFLALKSFKPKWRYLKAHLDDSSHAINLVFAPDAADELRDSWRHDPRKDNYTILDEEMLRKLYDSTREGMPLRRILHRKADDLTTIGLFKCEGVVNKSKNIFVGREQAIIQIAQQSASAVWGGRRIGKTSLLAAVADRLPAYYGFTPAFVYVDYPEGDPDLQLARSIAKKLNFKEPLKIEDLRHQLMERSKETPIAILIDEMDTYILASRQYHGPTVFPLARMLRGLVQTDVGRFKVVYAGFKQLFYEIKVRPNADTSDPFKNHLEPVTNHFGNLKADDVEKFIQIAFRDMLGIDFEDNVPRLVKEKTLGHPAFVQMMGERLLGLITDRLRLDEKWTLTSRDVEQVYSEQSNISGTSYIDYVAETLGWNLSWLGRAILLALSIEIQMSNRSLGYAFTRREIIDALKDWTDEYQPPEDCPDIKWTLDSLVMTNMLKATDKDGSEANVRYSVAYSFYVDVLGRLGDSNKLEVSSSLASYKEKEAGTIQ